MSRRRRGLRAAQRDWNYVTREIARAAANSRPRCGCPVNAPEADANNSLALVVLIARSVSGSTPVNPTPPP